MLQPDFRHVPTFFPPDGPSTAKDGNEQNSRFRARMTHSDNNPIRPEFLPLSLARALWKRKWLGLALWAFFCLATAVVVYRLPAVYRSESLILIENQRIPERYVAGTMKGELDNRLSMLTQQIKSYDNLVELIEQFNLYRRERQTLVEEEIIEKMRNDIQVEIVKGWDRNDAPAFRIAYQGSDPRTVARVTNEIRERFLRENLKLREEQAVGTSEFLERQLEATRADLEKQETRLSEYKERFNGQLPEQAGTLSAMLNRLETRLQGLQESVNQNRQSRLLTENSLAAAEASATAFAGLAGHANGEPPVPPAPPSVEEIRVAELETELASLRLRYSEDHPDIRRVAGELGRARQALAMQPPTAVPAASLAPAKVSSALLLAETARQQQERIQALKTQLVVSEQEMQQLNDAKKSVMAEISSVQQRINNLPVREQELAKEIRDYDISKANYQSLLNKRMEADMAANMEVQQKAERFTVLDVARVPSKPIKPRRELLLAAGCFCGLLLGGVFGFGMEWKKNVILGEWELEDGVIVLGRVPHIPTAGAKDTAARPGARRRLRRLVLAPTLVLLVGALLATGYYSGWTLF